jgi:hypothetical protein
LIGKLRQLGARRIVGLVIAAAMVGVGVAVLVMVALMPHWPSLRVIYASAFIAGIGVIWIVSDLFDV